MNLLLKRSQGTSARGKPIFKLWAKVEFEGDEKALIDRYKFESYRLIEALQPGLLRLSGMIGLATFVIVFLLFNRMGWTMASLLGLAAGGAAAWFFYDRMRETVFVKDLIHGRYFDCGSVIELARKEAWLGVLTAFLRQVMESAKHWDGTETVNIEALPKEEAKYVVLRGL